MIPGRKNNESRLKFLTFVKAKLQIDTFSRYTRDNKESNEKGEDGDVIY